MNPNINGSLLILGNGFDLNCGLRSSFSHFFESINNLNNIWYLLFFFAFDSSQIELSNQCIIENIKNNDILWMDVEDLIKRVLYMHREDNAFKGYLLRVFGSRTYCEIINLAFTKRNDSNYFYKYYQFVALKDYFKKCLSLKSSSFNVYTFLFDELNRFEDDFKNYLIGITKDNQKYLDNTGKILKELSSGEEAYDILTFNYTLPDKDSINLFAYGSINHIHGSLDTDIIIGYDSGNVGSSMTETRLKMSKAWQKLFSPFSPSYLPKPGQIISLKVYGHSLGEQDYSYFYSPFDYYDIYNSDVELIFYYTPYSTNQSENDNIRSRYISAIYSLLNSYMAKTENSAKGNIVINKLILENRLKIQTITKVA